MIKSYISRKGYLGLKAYGFGTCMYIYIYIWDYGELDTGFAFFLGLRVSVDAIRTGES